MLRDTARSTFLMPGPMITFLAAVPNGPRSGVENAAGSKKRDGVGFGMFGSFTRFGRLTIGLPVPDTSALTIADSGVPDCNVPTACTCQFRLHACLRPG